MISARFGTPEYFQEKRTSQLGYRRAAANKIVGIWGASRRKISYPFPCKHVLNRMNSKHRRFIYSSPLRTCIHFHSVPDPVLGQFQIPRLLTLATSHGDPRRHPQLRFLALFPRETMPWNSRPRKVCRPRELLPKTTPINSLAPSGPIDFLGIPTEQLAALLEPSERPIFHRDTDVLLNAF